MLLLLLLLLFRPAGLQELPHIRLMEVLSDISSVRLYSAQTYRSYFLKVLLFTLNSRATPH